VGCEFLGRYWGEGGSLGAVIMGCVVYGLGGCFICGLVCSTSSGFSSGFSVGVFGLRFPFCMCVCVCVCVRARARVAWCIWYFYWRGKKYFNERERM